MMKKNILLSIFSGLLLWLAWPASQAWAQAIHGASPRWGGIRYVSRQMNKGFAYAIFERSGLRKLRTEKLKAQQVDDLCDRFNVTAV